MNPLIPLEIFIPPPEFEHIQLLMTHDRNGLNNGVFCFKVNEWSLKLFSYALAFGHFNPEVVLKYTEQSAMEEVLKEVGFPPPHLQECPDNNDIGMVQQIHSESPTEVVQWLSSTRQHQESAESSIAARPAADSFCVKS